MKRYGSTIVMLGLFFCGHKCNGSEFDKQVDLHVRVLAEARPVEGANVKGGFKRRMGGDKPIIHHVLTDINGAAQMSAKTSGQVSIKITKDEYYCHYEGLDLYHEIIIGPVSTSRTIELKKVQNPVPMYAKWEEAEIPQDDKDMGYDLEKGDWVTPYGRGVRSDLIFKSQLKIVDNKNYAVLFDVRFSGEGNGIQLMHSGYPKFEGSALRSNHLAPLDGYQPVLLHKGGCKNGRYNFGLEEADKIAGYYFRVRTVLDENGTVISALYGKVYGGFRYGRFLNTKTAFNFKVYLNPDKTRNVEFDPQKNLFLKTNHGYMPLGRAKACYSTLKP